MIHLGSLVKVDPIIAKNNSSYVLEMGLMDLSGFEVQNLDEILLHVETVE